MNLITLSWKNLWVRKLSSSFTILILVLGIGISLFVYQVASHVQAQFENNISGIDMVVGAKGSPLQLILSAIFQIDTPTGNITLEDANKISKNRWVQKAIPLSYGDSYRGIRIVGSDTSYLGHYSAKMDSGRPWTKEMEVVLGSAAAKKLNLTVGSTFLSAHGLATEGMAHDDHPYEVKGLLAPTNSVLDNLILTATESIWHVHGGEKEDKTPEITALLVSFSSPMGLIRMPRSINQGTNMQAALTAFEINKLFSMLGIGIEIVKYVGWILLAVAAASLWINLTLSLQNRSYELAVLRTYGASRFSLFISIVMESIWLVGLGYLLGVLFSQIGLMMLNQNLATTYGYEIQIFELSREWIYLFFAVLAIGLLSSAYPAIKSINKDISKILAE